MTPLVSFDRATVELASGAVALRDVTWRIHDGETWAIVGPIGSGKSTLAETLLGRHRPAAGSVTWPFLDGLVRDGRPVTDPAAVMRFVSFKEHSARFSYGRHYYQQRFNFIDPEDDLTLDEFLRDAGPVTEDEIREVTDRLGVAPLRSLSFIKLSNGQSRRARIAKALLARPEWLILDEPFLGLDQAGRADLVRHLDEVRLTGTRLLVISRPEFLPPWVTHIYDLGRGGGTAAGPRHGARPDAIPLGDNRLSPSEDRAREPVIELTDIHVRHGGRAILRGLNWTVRAGERWALTGPNGSGKSTLLGLIYGDHPQAYSNDVTLFGRARGTGETIWDLKKRIGFVSPEFHLYFSESLTAARTAATGFFDGVTPRITTPEQDEIVRDLFDEFGLLPAATRPFRHLSTGQQRLTLLIRALVKRPELLLLDEPFQGLDAPSIAAARTWLETRLSPNQTLVFVSHDPDEIPQTVTKRLHLDGIPVSQGNDQ